MFQKLLIASVAGALLTIGGCAGPEKVSTVSPSKPFSIAVVPDTQNYLDFTHQKATGFVFDASDMFIAQMQYLADNAVTQGGDIAFVTHLGDVWQHQTLDMDAEHKAAGFKGINNPWLATVLDVDPDQVTDVEMPKAVEGFRILDRSGIPFGVAPGNHDYDAMWSAAGWEPVKEQKDIRMTAETLGMLHAGGLDNFRSVFGNDSAFFKDKPWYISSYKGGANSAQTFTAGEYTFLNISLEMAAADDVLQWASEVIQANPGLPTIISTHDYLSVDGERKAVPIIDFHKVDPNHNSAELLWQKFIRKHDQIFMVLSGHQHGQSIRIDENEKGHQVYQILADYQDRGQAGLDAGQAMSPYMNKPVGLGDGWFRLMTFDLGKAKPVMNVTTYSTHYKAKSIEIEDYASWYRQYEQPSMTDDEFQKADHYQVELIDFHQRFGPVQDPS